MQESEFGDEEPTLPEIPELRLAVTPPQHPKLPSQWYHLLHSGFHGDPDVVLVLVPDDGELVTCRSTEDGVEFLGVRYRFEGKERLFGLKLLGGRAYGNWADHAVTLARSCKVEMVPPVYMGPLSTLPQEHLVRDELPFLFLKDRLSLMINLRAWFKPGGTTEKRSGEWV